MTTWQAAAFVGCVALAACAQGITGFALALILLGLTGLFELAPLPDAANVATVLSIATALVALRGTGRSLDWSIWRPTVAGSLFGVAAGVALLAWLNANVVMALRLLLGLVVVACAVVVLVRAQPRAQRSSRVSFNGFGFLSGLLGGLFSASGPPLVYHFYRQPVPVATVRDTLLASLSAGAVLRLAMVLASGQFSAHALRLCLLSLPPALAITWWMRAHPPAWPREGVLKIVCALLVVTGVGLIGPALQALVR